MESWLEHVRLILRRLRRPTLHAARLVTRLRRTAVYGFDLVLWSRLVARRRSPIPLELPQRLLEKKAVSFSPPAFHVNVVTERATRWEEGFAAVNAGLFLNLQKPDVLSSRRYAHPAPAFKGVYLWDSAFIAQIWKWWDPATAIEILRAVLDLRDGPRLQHVVADLVSSPYTQPPLIAWSLHEIVKLSPHTINETDLIDAFEILTKYHEWLRRERMHSSGLFFWEHCYESGVENAPRFGSRDERQLIDTREMASPDLCSYVILQCEALAGLAKRLGRGKPELFTERAETLRRLMNERLWHQEDGIYHDRRFSDGGWIRSRTIAGLLPLWAGVPDAPRARRMLEQVTNPAAFGTRLPFPSVAADDPNFELDMWRGPVWINTAYGALLGLRRHGFQRELAELAWRLCDGVFETHANTRRIYEFFHPNQPDLGRLNRKLGNRWKKLTLGNKPRPDFVGWSGLVNTIVIEHLIGINRHDGRLCLQPMFPPQAAGYGFSLRLPAFDLALQLDIEDADGTARGTVRYAGRATYFHLTFGETYLIP